MSADPEASINLVNRTVVVRHELQAGRERVWRALTTDELAHWLGRPDGLPHRMGARFALAHDEWTTSTHRVTRWRPQRLMGWTWQFPEEDDSSLTLRLAGLGPDQTLLIVEHRGVEPVVGYAAGWWLHLDRLGARLAGQPRDPRTFWDEHAVLVQRLSRLDGLAGYAAEPGSRRVGG